MVDRSELHSVPTKKLKPKNYNGKSCSFCLHLIFNFTSRPTKYKAVRARLVSKIDHYIYSDASNYVNETGVVKVELIEIPQVDMLKPSSFDKYICQ